jgi:hypothetical protein
MVWCGIRGGEVKLEIHQAELGLQPDPELEADWHALVELGPRAMGSQAAEHAVTFLLGRLDALGVTASLHNFTYLGWREQTPPRLILHAPESRELAVANFLWSGATPGEGIRGRVVHLGQHIIWDLYVWERFALVNSAGEILAYISGRPDGEAIPQALPAGSSHKPHLALGTGDQQQLKAWLQAGMVIEATILSHTDLLADQVGANVVGSLGPRGDGSAERIVICAHYDSMPTTPGAYDNASGSAVLLALARHLAHRPPPVPIDLIWFGGEEWNLAGSRAYVRDRKDQVDRMQFVVNVDGMGRGNLLEVWVGPEALEIAVRDWLQAFGDAGRVHTLFRLPPPAGSDHTPFFEAGVPAVMFTFNDLEILHSRQDVYDPVCLPNMAYVAGLLVFVISKAPRWPLLRPDRTEPPFGWQRL